jgi:hypothetical protein
MSAARAVAGTAVTLDFSWLGGVCIDDAGGAAAGVTADSPVGNPAVSPGSIGAFLPGTAGRGRSRLCFESTGNADCRLIPEGLSDEVVMLCPDIFSTGSPAPRAVSGMRLSSLSEGAAIDP